MANKLPEDYRHYTANDFLLDEFFQQWVQNPDKKSESFWETFMRQYPQQAGALLEAKETMLGLHFNQHILPAFRKQQLLQGAYQLASQEKKQNPHRPQGSVFKIRKYGSVAAAAVFLLLMTSAVLMYHWYTALPIYTTAYGETKTFTLPDGTVVKLNANSSLEADIDMQSGQPREVWLSGEAYFEVKKLSGSSASQEAAKRFIVHTNEAKVEVLGTQFNVNSRQQKTQVVLNEGSVKVLNPVLNTSVIMKPGEIVELGKNDSEFKHNTVNAAPITAWKDQMFIFDNATLLEVADEIREYYGVDVHFADNELANKIFNVSGVPRQDLDMLLSLIRESFRSENIDVVRKNNQVSFKYRKMLNTQ